MRNQTTRSSLPQKSNVDLQSSINVKGQLARLASVGSSGEIQMFDEKGSWQGDIPNDINSLGDEGDLTKIVEANGVSHI